MYYEDTIAAISTPLGRGGIGIVRMSGPEVIGIGDRVFISRRGRKLSKIEPWKLSLGHIYDKELNRRIDEVLSVYMPAPHTYTREDVMEVNCHSGLVVLDRILQLFLREGARLAEPGEFTRRAFLNGRIDLSQAEAVLEVVDSKTTRALEGAIGRLSGKASEALSEVKEALVQELVAVEATIDFAEEDIPLHDGPDVVTALELVCKRVRGMVREGEVERIYSEGILLAIVGAPNVGKSSLFNALLEEDRAIVTEVPGTTSDVIQEYLSVEGIPVKIADTAGIRKPKREIEAHGVERSLRAIRESEVVLLVMDGSTEPSPEDIELFKRVDVKKLVLVANKRDLGVAESARSWCEGQRGIQVVYTSAINGGGIEELGAAIKGKVMSWAGGDQGPYNIGNSRQIAVLERALRDIEASIHAARGRGGMEIVAFFLREAIGDLSEVGGSELSEKIIDEIFTRFCVGK